MPIKYSLICLKMEYYKTEVGCLQVIVKNKKLLSIKFIDKVSSDQSIVNIKLVNFYKKFDKYDSDQLGTDFQIKVWNEIKKIPFGKTESYQKIAENIGHPYSCRAVANACGKNKLPLIIPCHRVVGKNNMGGYEWGIIKKKLILEKEKI